jgi:class 3 adenylate cyclase
MSSASHQLFAAGLLTDALGAERAIEFVVAARETVAEFADEHGVDSVFRAGLAAGDVVAGVIGTERIAFDVWGHPSRLAVALAAVARPGGVLVDDTVVDAVGEEWSFEPDPGLVGLGGERLTGSYLGERERAPQAELGQT